MPGFLIQQGATVTCAHGAPAMPSVPNPAVTLSGMPSALLPMPWVVTGCPAAAALNPPCITVTWLMGTVRVTSFGQPLVIQSGTSICAPSGLPLMPIVAQTRVAAQ